MERVIGALRGKIYSYPKAFEWFKLIAVTGSSQIIIQVIGLVSGILIIRVLPINEYALYTPCWEQ
jgi:hypothetical protein